MSRRGVHAGQEELMRHQILHLPSKVHQRAHARRAALPVCATLLVCATLPTPRLSVPSTLTAPTVE